MVLMAMSGLLKLSWLCGLTGVQTQKANNLRGRKQVLSGWTRAFYLIQQLLLMLHTRQWRRLLMLVSATECQ